MSAVVDWRWIHGMDGFDLGVADGGCRGGREDPEVGNECGGGGWEDP